MGRPLKSSSQKPAKEKLLEAAFQLIRSKGYSSTTVEEICELAGVTKGTFFHYFDKKESLAVEAAKHWSFVTGTFFNSAPFQKLTDPLDRILGYIDFRKKLLRGKIPEFTCLVGTMVQETYDSNPQIRKACKESIFVHAKIFLEQDIIAAKKLYAPDAKWSAKNLALHTQCVIQGAFILAKAGNSSEYAIDSIDHLKNYINFLFNQNAKNKKKEANV